MAKRIMETMDPKDVQLAALRSMAPKKDQNDDGDVFNIVPRRKLPEGFENPPCGDENHRCLDAAGCYRPDWIQLKLIKTHDRQRDPHPVQFGQPLINVPLDEWVDVPAHVAIALADAIEVNYEQKLTPGMIKAGQPVVRKATKRKRFVFEKMKSA